jgi:hypothetical protein
MTKYREIGSCKEEVITNAYDPQLNQEKYHFIENISYINTLRGNERWILGGDFNIILTLEEKSGGLKRLENNSNNFHHLTNILNLTNIETRNGPYTWTNKRVGTQHISNLLDHFLISEKIMLEGRIIEENIIPKADSYHSLV